MNKYIIILLLFPVFASGTNIYMNATSGSDGAGGTSPASAWQTLPKLNGQFLQQGDTVFFNRGDIFPGRLNLTRTGLAGNPVVYTTYGTGADPIITGYITLSTWTNNGGGIYASAAPGIHSYAHNLKMDGSFQNIARQPNSGFITFTPGSTTSITTSESSPPNHIGDSIVVKSSRYTLDHSLISGQTGSAYTISAVTYSGVGGIGFFYFNSSKWLDTAGEWIVNSTQDSVYVYFGGGGPGGHTVQVAVVDTLVYATGSFIHAINLHFTGGNMFNFLNPFGSGNILLDSCTIDWAYDAIAMRSIKDTVQNGSITDVLNNGITWPSNDVTKYSAVINDTFRRIGLLPGMGRSSSGNYEAVNAPAADAYFYHNNIKNVGYHGIYTSADSFVVINNIVDSFCITLSDGGGIYTWDGSTVSYTHQRKIIGNIVQNGIGNTEGITVDPGTMAMGIYTDGRSNLVLITDNTVVNNSGMGLFNHGTNMTYYRNNVYNNGLAQALNSEYAGGVAISGVTYKYNNFASIDTSRAVIFFYTPNNDLLTMGTADSNYYASTNGITPFKTQANGGALIVRTLANWQSTMSFDSHSTYQTGTLTNTINYNQTSTNRYLTGRYKDLPGIQYVQLVPLSAYSSAILLVLDTGIITFIPGSKIIVH